MTPKSVSQWMSKRVLQPVVLLVDSDAELLARFEAEAREHWGDRCYLITATTPADALSGLIGLLGAGAPIALVVAAQRLAGMSGVELLRQTRRLAPSARCVLAADLERAGAAFAASDLGALDYFLVKPWEPLAEKLLPVLDRLLEEWRAEARPGGDSLRLAGSRWSPESYAAKEFLSRNLVRYRWVDVDEDPAMREVVEQLGGRPLKLPVVFFPDGRQVVAPTLRALADEVGLKTAPAHPFYDLVVVGCGPAGLASAVYGASEGLHTLVVEQSAPGGQAGTSSMIENYLGFPAGVSGADLAMRAMTQAQRFGAEILTAQEVVGLRREDPYRVLRLADGREVYAHAVVIATGMRVRQLEVPGLERLLGIGVYYGAAATEAATYRGQPVVVVGGANSAGQGALFFSRTASRVTMLIKKPSLAPWMSQYLVDRIAAAESIDVVPGVEVAAVAGEGRLERVEVCELASGAKRWLDAAAMFLFVGASPRSEMLADSLARDERGFLSTGADLSRRRGEPLAWSAAREPLMFETNVPGVFAVGDVRAGANRRVAAAVGEGSAVMYSVHKHLTTV
ncbi:MAG TPA: FAD-dependent oxidoreductase [Thermoanaerobaculia bacterium]